MKKLFFFSVFFILASVIVSGCRKDDEELVDDTPPGITFTDSVVFDTVWTDSVVLDTVKIDSIVYDTIRIDSIVYDTIRIDSIIYDTVRIDSIVYDTVKIDSIVYYTIQTGNVTDPEIVSHNIQAYLKKKVADSQGMCIWNDKVFVLHAKGACDVYDFKSKKYLASFQLGSSDPHNHCNSASWGIETIAGASFPLMYVNNGQVGVASQWQCNVESITYTNGEFKSELVQTITLDVSGFKKAGYQKPWGCPGYIIDYARGDLWIWSANKRTTVAATGDFSTNLYHATKFRIPSLSEGKEVTLTAADILDQKCFEFDAYVTQGACMHDGKIYHAYGLGTAAAPSKIRVYDTDQGIISQRINLEGNLDVELEDLELYNGRLYINTYTNWIYEMTDNQ